MKYTAEYLVAGSSGRRIKANDDLRELLAAVRREGCRITDADVHEAMLWAETAVEGKRHITARGCDIRRGAATMTEYTSF